MTAHRVTNITFLIGPDKVSATSRLDRGTVIAAQAPQSPLYTQHADMKTAADGVVANNTTLKTALDAFTNAEAELGLTRAALTDAVTQWDGAYGVFVSTGEKYAATPADAHALGAVALARASHPLAPPVAVAVKYDASKNLIRVRIQRPPGMRLFEVQMSADPVTATSWSDLAGNGAMHVVPMPAKGTWWFRACSVTSRAKSGFTSPVSVLVT
jgi:hypothetical protein